MTIKKNIYEIEIGSPPDYEELVAYIYLSDKSIADIIERRKNKQSRPSDDYVESEEIALLHKEEGPDKVKIRFSEYAAQNDLDVDKVLKVIKEAKEELLK